MSKRHLRFKLREAYDVGETRHAQEVMRSLGITYKLAVPQTMGDQWWFFNCDGIPKELPSYITPLDGKLKEYLGFGLSQEDIENLR